MQVVLNSSFTIADDISSFAKILGDDSFALRQETQTVSRARAAWLTAFHDRAVRSVRRTYVSQFPPCASEEAAFEQALSIPVQCPRGGTLVETFGSTAITYSDAWIDGEISVKRNALSNVFTFPLVAIDPSTATLSPLAQMDSRYIANLSAIVGLTGGGATKLDGYTTTDVAAGFTAFLPALLISSIAVPKMMQLVTGTDAENADPAAGLIIIRPDDYNAGTNAKVWKEKL